MNLLASKILPSCVITNLFAFLSVSQGFERIIRSDRRDRSTYLFSQFSSVTKSNSRRQCQHKYGEHYLCSSLQKASKSNKIRKVHANKTPSSFEIGHLVNILESMLTLKLKRELRNLLSPFDRLDPTLPSSSQESISVIIVSCG